MKKKYKKALAYTKDGQLWIEVKHSIVLVKVGGPYTSASVSAHDMISMPSGKLPSSAVALTALEYLEEELTINPLWVCVSRALRTLEKYIESQGDK